MRPVDRLGHFGADRHVARGVWQDGSEVVGPDQLRAAVSEMGNHRRALYNPATREVAPITDPRVMARLDEALTDAALRDERQRQFRQVPRRYRAVLWNLRCPCRQVDAKSPSLERRGNELGLVIPATRLRDLQTGEGVHVGGAVLLDRYPLDRVVVFVCLKCAAAYLFTDRPEQFVEEGEILAYAPSDAEPMEEPQTVVHPSRYHSPMAKDFTALDPSRFFVAELGFEVKPGAGLAGPGTT